MAYSDAMYKVPTPYDLSWTKASVFSWTWCKPSVGGGNDVIITILLAKISTYSQNNAGKVPTRALLSINLQVLREENAIRRIKTATSVITDTLLSFCVLF